MTKRILTVLAVVLVAALGAVGIARLDYNVDVLQLLPRGLPGAEGTGHFQRLFDRPGQLILTLESPQGEDLEDAAADLAEALTSVPGLARSVVWEPAWRSSPEILVELSAHALLNAPPEELRGMEDSLSPDRLAATLQSRLATISGSLDPMASSLAARDPLGLGRPLLDGLGAGGMEMGTDGFSSEDGSFRLLRLDVQEPPASYKESARWLDAVRSAVRSWNESRQYDGLPAITVGFTGTPAFAAEIGTGMEKDMNQSVSGITLVVGLLFWLLHRRIGPLFLLLGGMLAAGLVTLGIAGLAFGSLNVMSMGFAAILMGMIEDFGVMGMHEAGKHPGASFRAVHDKVFPSIAWSALATSAVFASLWFSTLPGIAQMGVLTAIGILAGAFVMLYGFLPLTMRWTRPKPGCAEAEEAKPDSPASLWPAGLIAGLAVFALAGLLLRGWPGVQDGSGLLRPKHCAAHDALMVLESRLQPNRDREITLPVVLAASDAAGLRASAEKLQSALDAAKASDEIQGYTLPKAFLPDAASQSANSPLLLRLSGERERLKDGLMAAGFNEEGFRFAGSVLERAAELARAARDGLVWVNPADLEALLGPVLRKEEDRMLACAFVRLPRDSGFDTPLLGHLSAIPGVHPAGWDYLSSQIKKLLPMEVRRVLLPASLVLAVLFLFVFRNARERLLAAGSLAMSGLLLAGGMSWLGLPWNFVNVGAVPLCLGLGLDFHIHMIYALRADAPNYGGIGRALAYCGLSTGLGFGALSFSDNVGLSSFGLTAMIGVLATLFTSAFVLPWAWSWFGQRNKPLAPDRSACDLIP